MEVGWISLVLAVLALVTVVWVLAGGLMETFQPKASSRIVLRVKNCETVIEGVVRSLLPQIRAKGWQVAVIDAGSDDDTPVILHRLNETLSGLEVLPPGRMTRDPLVEVELFHLQDSREGCRLVRKKLAEKKLVLPWF
jgi:hypothetical protein